MTGRPAKHSGPLTCFTNSVIRLISWTTYDGGMTTVGIYVRISSDREGAGLGVARQEEDCRELATRAGWTVVDVYADNDVSAYSGKRRTQYERLMADVAAGRINVILAWHTDRLHRQPRELEEFIDRIEAHRVQVHTVRAGELDLSTASGRAVARTLGAWARYESEHRSERGRRKAKQKADKGEVGVGGRRPFGYTRLYATDGTGRRRIVGDELNADEAPVVRDCVRRLESGQPLHAIVRWLNDERQVPTSTGGKWSQPGLRTMLRSPRIAGLREHRGVVVGAAQWPAIITRDEHERVRAILDRNRRAGEHTVRRHYLTGLVFCSDCADKGVSMQVNGQAGGRLVYSCRKATGGCNGRAIGAPALEDMMRTFLLRVSQQAGVAERLARTETHADERLAALTEKVAFDDRRLQILGNALDDKDEGELDEVLSSIRRVRRRREETRRQILEIEGVSPSVAALLPDLEDRWDDGLDVGQQHAVASAFVGRVLIAPALRGRHRFDPDRVTIEPAGRLGRA